MAFARRKLWYYLPLVPLVFVLRYIWQTGSGDIAATKELSGAIDSGFSSGATDDNPAFVWRTRSVHHPVASLKALPTGKPHTFPGVQFKPLLESKDVERVRLQRRDAVKSAFMRCWAAYRAKAWMKDEVTPISGGSRDTFGGWGATLVDSLDTLWIMGLRSEFEVAVAAAVTIDFESTTLGEINIFETNIRYLGGFLSAYDLSGDARLLSKAKEVGDMLYAAFDTPNRMPITRWDVHAALRGEPQEAHENVLLAEIGSLSMEFTRLSMITGDTRWFDAVQRITEALHRQQMTTQLPGMWPVITNARHMQFNLSDCFTLGAMADSAYEYLPKMIALTGGLLPDYRDMHEMAVATAINHTIFRPMLPGEEDILVSGPVNTRKESEYVISELKPEVQHLGCFSGGMLALSAKLLDNKEHLNIARKLVEGCIWAYKALPLGIMPESFYLVPCADSLSCPWNETRWKEQVLLRSGLDDVSEIGRADDIIKERRLPKGIASIQDTRYILRPEAIESVFVLYRVTGRPDLVESAWAMWEAIDRETRTDLANAALSDMTGAGEGGATKTDSMESFWMGETLKYFYLIFSEPDLISLDEYVFNTEAHPFRRLVP